MGRPLIDLTGRQYGKWTVLAVVKRQPGAETHWWCRCACGMETEVLGANLRRGGSTRCRPCAYRDNRADLVGDRYGRWTVLADAGRNANRDRLLLCRCVCGRESRVAMSNLVNGRSTQCRSCANRKRFSNSD